MAALKALSSPKKLALKPKQYPIEKSFLVKLTKEAEALGLTVKIKPSEVEAHLVKIRTLNNQLKKLQEVLKPAFEGDRLPAEKRFTIQQELRAVQEALATYRRFFLLSTELNTASFDVEAPVLRSKQVKQPASASNKKSFSHTTIRPSHTKTRTPQVNFNRYA
jgi:hypothetical protein